MRTFLVDSDINEIISRLGDATQLFAGKTVLLTGGRGFLGRYFMEVFDAMNRDILDTPVALVAMDNMITAGEHGAQFRS